MPWSNKIVWLMLVIEVFFLTFFKRLVVVGFIIIKKKKKTLRKVKSFFSNLSWYCYYPIMLNFKIFFYKIYEAKPSEVGVSRHDRDLPNQPTRLISTRFQLEPTLSSVGFRFLHPRPDASGSSGRFSSPKPEPPDPTEVIYKSDEISSNPRRSSEFSTIFGEI